MFCSVEAMSYVLLVFTRLYGLGGPLEILQKCFLFFFFNISLVFQLFTKRSLVVYFNNTTRQKFFIKTLSRISELKLITEAASRLREGFGDFHTDAYKKGFKCPY